jgi:hypothetical protein
MTTTIDTECPECNARGSDLRVVLLWETYCRIQAERAGEMELVEGHDTSPLGGTQPTLVCRKCKTRWPVPEDRKLFLVKDGRREPIPR